MDRSAGYERVAHEFIACRSNIGARTVRDWAHTLPRGAAVLDIACGHGVPISATLLEEGLAVYAIDASPTLVEAFRARFPGVPVECCTLEASTFFGRSFDAAIAWGVMFLLTREAQKQLIAKVSSVLKPGGSFLFTAPAEECEWQDNLTGLASISLGATAYREIANDAGLRLLHEAEDEGRNHYYLLAKHAHGTDDES